MSRENYDAKKSLKSSKMKAHHGPLRQSVEGIELRKGREGGEVDDVRLKSCSFCSPPVVFAASF
jgi:hypothetical protein